MARIDDIIREALEAHSSAVQPVLTPGEAAEVLRMSEDKVRQLVRAGRIPKVPGTSRMLIARRHIIDFAESGASSRVEPAGRPPAPAGSPGDPQEAA